MHKHVYNVIFFRMGSAGRKALVSFPAAHCLKSFGAIALQLLPSTCALLDL